MAAGVGSMTFDDDLAADGFGSGLVDDLFGDDDDIFNAPAPLPPLSPTNIDAVGNEEGEQAGEGTDDKKPKKKVVQRSPQPRLDDIRLCSERGIPALAKLCDGIKFKGKGHEASDLNVLLQRFEHWAHRLFPKFPFQDCVDQIETMGHKKLVQNTIKAVRRGETGEVNENNSDDELLMNGDKHNDDEQSTMNNANFGGQIHVETSSNAPNTPVPQLGLTPEQQERIRLNREKALAKRKQQQSTLASQTEDDQANTPSMSKGSEDTSLPGSQSPERSKLSFDTESDSVEATNEISDETTEIKSTEDETVVINEDKGEMEDGINKNETINDIDNEDMGTKATEKESEETVNIERETEESNDTIGTKDAEKPVDSNEDEALGDIEVTMETKKVTMETKEATMEVEQVTNETEEVTINETDKVTMETEKVTNETKEVTIETLKVTNETEEVTMETEIVEQCKENKDLENVPMET